MKNKEIKQKVESEGWILARSIIEIVGKPKLHVEKTIKEYLGYIKKNKNLIVVDQKINKAKKHDENLFATFAELNIMFKDLNELMYFCFDYMPSSLEIEEPHEMKYEAIKLTGFINDMQARLHEVDLITKQTKQKHQVLNTNFIKLLKNFSVVSCVGGKKLVELEKIIGMPQKHIEKVLDLAIKEKRVKKEGDLYTTIK